MGRLTHNLRSAQIILLLVSADFLASDYCSDIEIELALERHAQSEAVAIPIIVRPVDWVTAPFANLRVFPSDGNPVTPVLIVVKSSRKSRSRSVISPGASNRHPLSSVSCQNRFSRQGSCRWLRSFSSID